MWHGRAHEVETTPGASFQVACFGVGGHEYALDIMRIKEIINPVAITPVPNAPAFVEGLIELRGTFLAVIDLRRRFGLEATPLTRDSKYIIILGQPRADSASPGSGHIIGLVVDRVVEVCRLAQADVTEPPTAVRGPGSRFVTGLAKQGDRVIMMVDIDHILDPDEHAALENMELRG